MNVTSVEGPFTDEILAKNFIVIAEKATAIEEWLYHLDHSLADLARKPMEVVVKVPKTQNIKPFLIGTVAGVVAYRYFKRYGRKTEVFVENHFTGSDNTKPGHYEKIVMDQKPSA